MSERTLYMAWQDKAASRRWFPVGRLDADIGRSRYLFRYTQGAKEAREEAGFIPVFDFPEMDGRYESRALFPIFQNRVMKPGRPDFGEYLRNLDLDGSADPIMILAANGGTRMTDDYEVFPKITKDESGNFTCRFFLRGARHVSAAAQGRTRGLESEEELIVALELNNPATGLAVQIQTTDYHVIGWAPRYLVDDLSRAMAEAPFECKARVARFNPPPAPSAQRVLVEMTGQWEKHEPMSGRQYKVLAD